MDFLTDPNVWAAFLTLTVLEIVLGIDNIVFISVLVSKLPKPQADRARQIGLALALIFRILLLLVLSALIALNQPLFELFGHGFSWRDIILFAGGAFLIYKSVHEMHVEIEEPHEETVAKQAMGAFSGIIVQIILIDMVFSIDSIVTAIGMAQHIEVMIAAVIVAVGLMFFASGPIADFVAKHPTTKMLALAFLLLIGVTLVADGIGFHIDKAYIYAAMGFAVLVEAINIISKQRKVARASAMGGPSAPAKVAAAATVPESIAADAVAGKSRPKSTPASRARARPKSAPRRK